MARIFRLLLAGASIALSSAANCGSQNLESLLQNQIFPDSILYGARQSMCEGSISCDSQKTQSCLVYFRISADYDFTLNATSTSSSYPNCFGALQDIIEQCYDQGYSSGSWIFGAEAYNMRIESNTLEDQFVPDVPNPAQVPLPAISLINEPDLLIPFQESTSVPTSTTSTSPPTSTSSAANCPSVPPCAPGKACPDPVPCDQLSCSKDCCGTIPNPQWCNENCGGISC